MKPDFENASGSVYRGECLEVLQSLGDSSVDSIVTDPPYGLEFMGQRWDYDVPSVEIWAECLRVLKPGGHLLAFAGTRTQHRMAVRIEDAGFEIRDMLAWVYGSGMPKSYNLKREGVPGFDGWGTALKPALEPITLARKPLVGTVASNVLEHGTGALNVDGCRVEGEPWSRPGSNARGCVYGGFKNDQARSNDKGRWPANLVHDGSEEVIERFPADAGAATPVTRRGSDTFRSAYGALKGNTDEAGSTFHGDQGSAARFFYCAKASQAERGADNRHPTVKPLALMRWLVRMITPPGGIVLDPFLGSGSTARAAQDEGFRFIGIEREAEHFRTAIGRLAQSGFEWS